MKLKFDKGTNGEISVVINEGTESFDFSYIALIKGMLNKQELSCEFSGTVEAEEQKQISELIADINRLAKPSDNNTTEIVEQF